MFTLSGGHVFPLYDGAVRAEPPMRIVDVRHEQTAVFAAEATARLTRAPGLAVLTAGPGVTNGISAVTTAHFNGSPVVIIGGRAPDYRWGSGSLQELDHPALLAPVTKRAWTEHDPAAVGPAVARAFAAGRRPAPRPGVPGRQPGGPVRPGRPGQIPAARPPARPAGRAPDPGAVAEIARLLGQAARPVLVLGSDVWLDGAADAARGAAEALRLPVIANGQGRGILPRRARATGDPGPAGRVRAGRPGPRGGHAAGLPARLRRVRRPGRRAEGRGGARRRCAGGHCRALRAGRVGRGRPHRVLHRPGRRGRAGRAAATRTGCGRLAQARDAAVAADAALLSSEAAPIHPLRIYGELARLLEPDAVVIGDGGDFVSYAGKYLEPQRPGGWLDPGPYGCLGTGPGYAIAARIARPSAQVVLLLGDGAAGFSLMDADTLVRHRLPVVMICGNNGIWGLEKHPMQALYGYDVAADLQPGCRYDEVVSALGGAGETVTEPGQIGPALRRAFDAGVPYLVNVITDPKIAYPRSTTGV